MKYKFYQIHKIVFLVFIVNIPNLYAHNLFNGGCKEHCGKNITAINNKNQLNKLNYHVNIESKNSCLNKSLCRG